VILARQLPDDSIYAIIPLQMADDAAKIVEQWRKHVPPQVPKEEVARVVEAYFPRHYHHSESGSHFLIVEHEALRLAGQHGWSANFRGGTLSISHTKGRYVKAYLVRFLLEAIDIKEAFDAAKRPEQDE
jgi:hypothetical protein